MPDTGKRLPVLDADTTPDMFGNSRISVAPEQIVPHQGTALRKDLEKVPIGLLHDIEDTIHELQRDILMEEVTHGVDEYSTRTTPTEGLINPLGTQGQVEPHLEMMPRGTTEALRESLGITVIATPRNLGATRQRIPSRISPLNSRTISYDELLNRKRSCPHPRKSLQQKTGCKIIQPDRTSRIAVEPEIQLPSTGDKTDSRLKERQHAKPRQCLKHWRILLVMN